MLDLEVGLGFEDLAHFEAVGLLVALGAGRPDGGAARGVEQAELDADGVGDFGHDAAEGVDLADEVSLGDAADGGVAGHLRDEVGVEGEQGGAQSHARGGHGGLAAGMTGSDDGDIDLFGNGHGGNSERADILAAYRGMGLPQLGQKGAPDWSGVPQLAQKPPWTCGWELNWPGAVGA